MNKLKYFCLAIAIIAVGCQQSQDHFKEKKQLNINFSQEPVTFDPRKNADYTSSALHFLLYEGLTTLSPKEFAKPAMAERYEISKDLKTYTFYLRPSKWSNGDEVTAYDFEKTWKDMLNPNFPCPNAHLLFSIKNAKKAKRGQVNIDEIGVKALDSKRLEVTLNNPTPYFLELIAFCVFSPVNHKIVTQNPNWADSLTPHLVSNGPYRVTKYKRSGHIILEKNPYYWDAENISLENIHISLIENDMTAFQMYQQNQLDILGLPFTSIPSDCIKNLREENKIQSYPTAASTVCFFNVNRSPFHNKKIRQAFAYAINRKSIIEHITQLEEKLSLDVVPSVLKNGKSVNYYEDNQPELALQLFNEGLEELGLTKEDIDGSKFLHASVDVFPKLAQVLQEQWRKVLGVEIQLEGFDYKTFLDKLVSRDFDFAVSRWIAQYNDQMNILDRFQYKENPKNYCGWYHDEYNKLIKTSVSYQDQQKRFEVLAEAEKILCEEMPLSVIYHWNSVYLKQPYLKNLKIYPAGGFHIHGITFD